MLRGGHFSGGHLTPSNVRFRAPWVGAGVDTDPASGSCELDGLPAVLEGRWGAAVLGRRLRQGVMVVTRAPRPKDFELSAVRDRGLRAVSSPRWAIMLPLMRASFRRCPSSI